MELTAEQLQWMLGHYEDAKHVTPDWRPLPFEKKLIEQGFVVVFSFQGQPYNVTLSPKGMTFLKQFYPVQLVNYLIWKWRHAFTSLVRDSNYSRRIAQLVQLQPLEQLAGLLASEYTFVREHAEKRLRELTDGANR